MTKRCRPVSKPKRCPRHGIDYQTKTHVNGEPKLDLAGDPKNVCPICQADFLGHSSGPGSLLF